VIKTALHRANIFILGDTLLTQQCTGKKKQIFITGEESKKNWNAKNMLLWMRTGKLGAQLVWNIMKLNKVVYIW